MKRISSVTSFSLGILLTVSLLLVSVAAADPLQAQVVETPVAFDNAGRVMVLSPQGAARARLGPPAWRVTGDFQEARLYRVGPTGSDEYALVVTRRTGAVERYPLTAADVGELRRRVSELPPQFAAAIDRNMRNAFIRNHTLLGLTVYAPSFAYTVTGDDVGRTATWLVVSGVSYFGAATIAREMAISPAQNSLSSWGALHGALAGLGTGIAVDLPNRGRAAAIFFGSVGGAAGGLAVGRDVTADEVAAMVFGGNAGALTGLGVGRAVTSDRRSLAAAMVGAGAAGYPLGLLYARSVPHNVTAGDVTALGVAGAVGALAATPFLAGGDPSTATLAAGLTIGWAAGLIAGDALLVRRFDHTEGEAGLLALGAGAGALMGAGVATLIDRSDNDVLVGSLATAGAIGGIFASQYFTIPADDAGRLASLRLNPMGLALALSGAEGRHPLLQLTF